MWLIEWLIKPVNLVNWAVDVVGRLESAFKVDRMVGLFLTWLSELLIVGCSTGRSSIQVIRLVDSTR
jgi:hypothetical protein